MVLKINFVDSKIMTIIANFFVKIVKVIFFPNTVIYKKNQAHPPRGRDSFHRQLYYTVLAIPANRRDTLESQPIGRKPPSLTNCIVK